MTKTIKFLTLFVSAVAILTAGCSDELVDASGNSGDNGGMQFEMTTEEMGHEVVSMGGTRAGAAMGTPSESDRFLERTLQGDNPYGLKVVRQPLPMMGFNRGAVSMPAMSSQTLQPQAQELTRAGANETVTGFTNFHDSLTIWGYTDGGTELFDQIILTKVRNWRNSVEWPYNQGNYMKFYAIAPSLESINMLATGGNFSAAPTFTYTLPEKPNELIDVLYGESENISITAGPAGTTSTNPKEENMGKDNKHVSLQFRHITTAVRFSQGTIPSNLRITSISIVGSRTVGTYNPGTTDAATATQGTWTYADGATTRTYTVSADHTGTGSAGSTDVPITGTPTLFLLPQTLPSGAKLQVTLEDISHENKEHPLTCSLEGDVWKKGFTVDYKITIGRVKEGYYLNLDGSSLTTTEVEVEHSTNAVSSTLPVYSYQLFYDYSSGTGVPSYTAVTWEIDGVSATGENDYVPWASKPSSLSWLTDFRGVSSGSVYEGGYSATASFTLAGQDMKYSTEHAIVLSENSKAGTASGLDLSRYDPNGVAYANRETANCYIVNRTGSYTFPLFYGNMTSDNNSQKACFKDHKGATIAHYDIKSQLGAETPTECASKGASAVRYLWSATTSNGIRPTVQAVLLWQDVSGMITEVTPLLTDEGGKGIIQFKVGISQPGNAVIALQVCKVNFTGTFGSPSEITYGDWETAWTWHIWMTDEVYANEGKDDEVSHDAFYVNGSKTKAEANHIAQLKSGDKTYEILPVDLGWVPDASTFGLYEKRSVWVRLKQTGSDNKAIVKITQHARQDLYTGTGTVYQWGRPTAFPALRNLSGGVRNVYNGSGNITSKFVLAQATSGAGYGGDAISNTFGVLQWETNPNSWFDVNSADYVTANAMWNSSKKTVYDPCPPGFRVPPASVFYGFSKTGTTVQSGKGYLNMWPEAQDLNGVTQKNGVRSKGGYFYCNANETNRYGDMVYMPATGEWHGNKSVGMQLQEPGEQLNQTNGLFWTSDYNNDDKDSKACLLWITPEYTFSAGTADKPVIGFFNGDPATNKLNYYSNLRGIRPMKIKIE